MNNSYELSHFGVKGMRWGVRRTPAQLGERNDRLAGKVSKYEVKAQKLKYGAEKSKRKTGNADASMVDTKGYASKAAKMKLKASKLERKIAKGTASGSAAVSAQKYRIKAQKLTQKYLRSSAEEAYGAKGYKQLMKSEKYSKKANKGRLEMERNKKLMKALESSLVIETDDD